MLVVFIHLRAKVVRNVEVSCKTMGKYKSLPTNVLEVHNPSPIVGIKMLHSKTI